MLVSGDDRSHQGATPPNMSQSGIQPGLHYGSAGHQVAPPQTPTPLTLPPPCFGTARRILGGGAQNQSSQNTSYILESAETGRRWLSIDSIKECQLGKILKAVELTLTSEGEWTCSPWNHYVAIKELSKTRINDVQGPTLEDPLREVAALQRLSGHGHPNVLPCIEALEDETSIYIIMPFCSGGELFSIVSERNHLEEHEARQLFPQMLDGLLFLKQFGMCHRDVSLENVLLGSGNVVKIIDLGLALRIPQDGNGRAIPLFPQGMCGKRNYMSPEVLSISKPFDGFAVDVWACGIVLFIMLTGIPPFDTPLPSQDQRCRVIAVEERLGELLDAWKISISPEAVNLIQSCLTLDPARRPSLEELRLHPWITSTS